jgi:hypothetical protein
VRNYERYQHYKNRRPPWVKLHRDLWFDQKFYSLSSLSKLYVIGFFTLASENDNRIPLDIAWIHSRLGIDKKPDFKELFDSGFIEEIPENASKVLAPCKQNAIPEGEEERETEKEGDIDAAPAATPPSRAMEVFYFWQSMPSLLHPRKFSDTDRRHVDVALESFSAEEIKLCIRRYNTVCADGTGRYWLTTRWTIGEFVSRKSGKWLTQFLPDDWEGAFLSDAAKRGKITAPDTVGEPDQPPSPMTERKKAMIEIECEDDPERKAELLANFKRKFETKEEVA